MAICHIYSLTQFLQILAIVIKVKYDGHIFLRANACVVVSPCPPQVVLPVLGYNAQYPENKVGQWYRGVLSRDGLQACRFRVPALKLNVPGCYRHILKHPHNVSYQLVHPDSDVNVEGSHANDVTSSLSISFDLDASCYATVSLREMMKGDV